ATLAHERLRAAQALISKHSRQELRALGRSHLGHHAQLFLSREVRIEELLLRHAEPTTQQVGHASDGVRDRGRRAVEIQLGARERARDVIAVPREVKIELDTDTGTRRGTQRANAFLRSPHGRSAIERPGDRLEDRGLSGPVRADYPGKAGVEVDSCVSVLPEVAEVDL